MGHHTLYNYLICSKNYTGKIILFLFLIVFLIQLKYLEKRKIIDSLKIFKKGGGHRGNLGSLKIKYTLILITHYA
jgi:hypothetical protein